MKSIETDNEALSALQDLLAYVQQDVDSYIVRTELHLSALAKARNIARGKSTEQHLNAAVNMVKAFLASAELFRAKWAGLKERLILCFPGLPDVAADELSQLELLIGSLSLSEQSLTQALGIH